MAIRNYLYIFLKKKYYLINYFPCKISLFNQETPNTVFVGIMQYENVEVDDEEEEEEENLVDDDVEDDEVQDDDDEDNDVEDEDAIVENEMANERIEKNDDEKEIFIDIDNKNEWGINYYIIYLRKK